MDTTTKTPKACIGDMFPSVFPGMPHHESVLRRGHARAGRCC